MPDTETKVRETEARDEPETTDGEGERTFTYDDMASAVMNSMRPTLLSLDALIHGSLIAVEGYSDDAYREVKMAQEDLRSISRHVNAAMTAIGHGPSRRHGISLGEQVLGALL